MYCYIIIVVLFLGIIIFLISRKDNFIENNPECICAFDLDNTITCGIDRAALAIKTCKKNNCKIAINTARQSRWHSDLKLDKLGLTADDYDSDFYHGEPFMCSFMDNKCLENNIASTKVKHLDTLSSKWNIEPRKIILFDDVIHNIEAARNSGYSTVFANHDLCGLPSDVDKKIEKILFS